MKQKTNKMLIFTSLAAYFTYFIHGIGASILGQYKPEFAAAWGAKPLADGTLDVSMVVSVIAALGLGRLISLPFSGPLSDKYGRKLSGIIGVPQHSLNALSIVFEIMTHKSSFLICRNSVKSANTLNSIPFSIASNRFV